MIGVVFAMMTFVIPKFMGMFDVAGAANVQVRKSGQYLQAGIHTVKFVGVGEQIDDMEKFNADDFINALFE